MKPKTPKIKTEWDLSRLFYKSIGDSRIFRDIAAAKKTLQTFENKYKKKTEYLHNARALHKALIDWEHLAEKTDGLKPLQYLHYLSDLDGSNKKVKALNTKLLLEMQSEENRVLFFPLALGTIPPTLQKKLLKNPILAPYRYYLEQVFVRAKHNLSEKEEQMMNLLVMPAKSMWKDGVSRAVSSLTITEKGKEIPLAKALGSISELPLKKRQRTHIQCMAALGTKAEFAESELNAIYTTKKISDTLRGYKKPYSATVLSYQNGEKEIERLVEAVRKRYAIAHRFYEVKRKILGLKQLTYADQAAKIGSLKRKMSFKDTVNIFRDVLYDLQPSYGKIFDSFLAQGKLDVYPKTGKRGGAYCSSGIASPTLVFLNHIDSTHSLMTLAHEMGHALHAELSKTQSPLYRGHSTAVAEVASTLFENITFERIWKTLSPSEQVIALHDRLNDAMATIFRQIATFEYELAMHTAVRERGTLTKEEMGGMHNKHMQEYLGKSVGMKKADGNFFVYWPHLRYQFYVYTYAYGELVSRALLARLKKDPTYLKKIDMFLRAGESKTPKDIFKDIGVDVEKPSFFIEGLKNIEEDVKRLERLTKKK
ncbi:MAG: M3 family metallopeptidase [Patescibacteria group bacterium]